MEVTPKMLFAALKEAGIYPKFSFAYGLAIEGRYATYGMQPTACPYLENVDKFNRPYHANDNWL